MKLVLLGVCSLAVLCTSFQKCLVQAVTIQADEVDGEEWVDVAEAEKAEQGAVGAVVADGVADGLRYRSMQQREIVDVVEDLIREVASREMGAELREGEVHVDTDGGEIAAGLRDLSINANEAADTQLAKEGDDVLAGGAAESQSLNAAGFDADEFKGRSVKQLKAKCLELGLNISHCVEKGDLVNLLMNPSSAPATSRASASATVVLGADKAAARVKIPEGEEGLWVLCPNKRFAKATAHLLEDETFKMKLNGLNVLLTGSVGDK